MKDSLYYRLRPAFEIAAPALFTRRGRLAVPAKRGINRDVVDLMSGRLSRTMVRNFLWRWFSRPEYLAAVALGGDRFDLEGRPCGEISEGERLQARYALTEKLAVEAALRGGAAWTARTLDQIGADPDLRREVEARILALKPHRDIAA
jgi:sRNA-binding protein